MHPECVPLYRASVYGCIRIEENAKLTFDITHMRGTQMYYLNIHFTIGIDIGIERALIGNHCNICIYMDLVTTMPFFAQYPLTIELTKTMS